MSPEIMTLFLAMLSAYVLALCLKAPPLVAFIAGSTFGFGSINVLYLSAGHATKVKAISMMPGVLAGVIYAFRRNMWGGAAITAFFLSMHIHANRTDDILSALFDCSSRNLWLVAAQQANQIFRNYFNLINRFNVGCISTFLVLKMTKDYSRYTTRVKLSCKTQNDQRG